MTLTTPSTITTSVQTTASHAATAILQEASRQDNSESASDINKGAVIGGVVGGIAMLAGVGIFVKLGRQVCNRVHPLGGRR